MSVLQLFFFLSRFNQALENETETSQRHFRAYGSYATHQLDQLFTLFRERPRWGIRPLREKTQQPEAYLKEVLAEIAFFHKSGEQWFLGAQSGRQG